MKFPITRECLQAFDQVKEQNELREEEIQKGLTQIIEQLCNEFKQRMPSNSKEKKFVWRQLDNIRHHHHYSIHPSHTSVFKPNLDEYLPRFIEKLKENFIGCDIIIDPLKTYLIIDWS